MGENLTSVTASLWPIYLYTLPVEFRFHTNTILSLEPDTICFLNYQPDTLADGNVFLIFDLYDLSEYLVISDQVRLRSFYLNIQLRPYYNYTSYLFINLTLFAGSQAYLYSELVLGAIFCFEGSASLTILYFFSIFIINF